MRKLYLISAIIFFVSNSYCQTVGLIQHSTQSLDDGYVLFAPIGSTTTYLIDKCGRQIKTWDSGYKPGQAVYILPDGTLLHSGNANNTTFNAGGKGGVIEKIDWNGNVTWSYIISSTTQCQHHDIKALPNGNVLVIAWESKTNTDALASGRSPQFLPATLWSEQILELQPVGPTGANIVWEWHLWDHLVQEYDSMKANYGIVSLNPQLVNLNFTASATNSDWIHMNAIDYNPALDQILLSTHAFSEIWIIDHSTNTLQAATHSGGNSGKGGDLLYRWGNPLAYNNGVLADKKFYGQHNARWIENGLPYANQIMVFNNGLNRQGGNYSTVEIIDPPVVGYNYGATLPYLPITNSWSYNSGNPNNFYAQNISSSQQLSNGNVLLSNGPAGKFLEVDSVGNTVWEYINPVSVTGVISQNAVPTQNLVFRCNFYPSNYPGFLGQALITGTTIENTNPASALCNLTNVVEGGGDKNDTQLLFDSENEILHIELLAEKCVVSIYNISGEVLIQKQINSGQTSIDLNSFQDGIYFVRLSDNIKKQVTLKIAILH